MVKIYHNPRCSKSREGVQWLQEKGLEIEIIDYMKNPISLDELKQIIKKLDIRPIELVRTKETIWKENFASKEMTDEEILQSMVDNPKLIERPIVVNQQKAVVARPTELIETVL